MSAGAAPVPQPSPCPGLPALTCVIGKVFAVCVLQPVHTLRGCQRSGQEVICRQTAGRAQMRGVPVCSMAALCRWHGSEDSKEGGFALWLRITPGLASARELTC